MSSFSLSALMNRSICETHVNDEVKKQSSTPSARNRVRGLSKITMEKKRLGVDGNKIHPSFIIYSVLVSLEDFLAQHSDILPLNPDRTIMTLLSSFQQDQIDLISLKQKADQEAGKSRKFMKQRSVERSKMVAYKVPGRGLWEKVLTKPEACSPHFLRKVRLHTAMIEKLNGYHAPSDVKAAVKSSKWLRNKDREMKSGHIIDVVKRRSSFDLLRHVASTNADARVFASEVTPHINNIEHAVNVNMTLNLLETQIEKFYEWRKSDVYKQVVKAYEAAINDERQLQKTIGPSNPKISKVKVLVHG